MEHREAIEHDLLVSTGYQLDDIGRTLSWSALDSFIRHLPPNSALMRELNPELARWNTTQTTNTILADIWDMLAHINANLVAFATRKPVRDVPSYPRPFAQKDEQSENKKHYGSGALPPDELKRWFEEKRRKRCQKSHKQP